MFPHPDFLSVGAAEFSVSKALFYWNPSLILNIGFTTYASHLATLHVVWKH